jgi:hypothetical protein
MKAINPWINFNGNAEEAFTFYKSVFGGEFAKIVRFKDIASDEFPMPENEANKIMQIALPVGKNNVLIAKAGKKRTNCLKDYPQAELLKGPLATVHGVHTERCLGINMVLSGSLNLTQMQCNKILMTNKK